MSVPGYTCLRQKLTEHKQKILPVCPEAAARREKKRKATAKASTLNANATNKRLVKAYF